MRRESEAQSIVDAIEFRSQTGNIGINILEELVYYSILLRRNFSLLVNLEGDCIPLKHSYFEKYIENDEFNEFLSKSFLSISISSILRDFMIKNEISKPRKKLKLLSESESLLLSKIRDEKVVSVKVKKNDKNELEMIEEFQNENLDKSVRLMDILLNQGYQTIEIKTQKGEIVNCTNIIKTKLENI